MVRCWNTLPKEIVDALFLEVFKARQHGPGQSDPVLELTTSNCACGRMVAT